MSKNLPKIAVVGRPNVGKSSLFNALIQKRKSLIDPQAGVTRDRIYEEVFLDDKYPVYFIDTGGISKTKNHDFIKEITDNAKSAIEEADIVLFIISVKNFTTDDQHIAEYLRKKAIKKTILVVNKVDNEKREIDAYEAYSFGFNNVTFTSAAHTKGISALTDIIISLIDKNELYKKNENDTPNEDLIRISLFGRPNVGKSSFLNLMLNKERSIVSDIPGTTRDVIEEVFTYKNYKMKIIDTAGVRRKSKISEKLEYVSTKKSMDTIGRSDIVFLLVDATEGVTEQDKRLADMAIKNHKILVIGINKWDLVPEEQQEKNIERIEYALRIAHFIPFIPISVKSKFNIDLFLNKALSLFSQYTIKLTTNSLTTLFRQQIRIKPLFSKHGELKVFYVNQMGIKPPIFNVIVNNKKLITPAYERFFHNIIRKKFNLNGIPLIIDIKNRNRTKK